MNRNIFLLTSISDYGSFVPVVQALGKVPGVISWQAVDGHANLLVIVQGSSDPFFDYLNRIAGQTSVSLCEVISEAALPPTLSGDLCYTWVFADVEPEKMSVIRNRLASNAGVVMHVEARGGCDLIALVSGTTLDEVDRIISHDIQPLDGLLRLKRNRVINLTSL
jgi:hypothetical protein